MPFSSVYIVDFEQVNVKWGVLAQVAKNLLKTTRKCETCSNLPLKTP